MGSTKLVAEIVEKGLCCGCGTCAGICPNAAITMHVSEGLLTPKIDEAKCTRCQLCVQACPGSSVDFEALRKRIFGQEPNDYSVGNYLDCYIGFSTDKQIRFDSASGGIITQLLIFALESKMVNGVIVTQMSKDNPLEPEVIVAKTREEVIEASKSKYCPVATNVCLSQILREEGRFAIVGLPCHLHGIRKAEALSKSLRQKIVLHLGLLCSHTVNFAGTYFLLEKLGVPKHEVQEIAYRGNGWPGELSVETKHASRIKMPLVGSWSGYWSLFSSFFFTPMRCTMCPDQAAELADISFGDAWLPELKHEKAGMSIIVSRTSAGQDLLDQAKSANAVVLAKVDVEKVAKSQFVNLKFKKNDLPTRLFLMRSAGKETPTFKPELASSKSFVSSLRAFYIYSNIKASSNRRFKSFLKSVPFPLIRLYYGVYKALCII